MELLRDLAGAFVKYGDKIFAESSDKIRVKYFNLCLFLWRSDCRIRITDNSFYSVSDGNTSWAIPHPLRSTLYRRGFDNRMADLKSSYSLDTLLDGSSPLTVVDCGANTGELALLLPPGSTYLGFEPDEKAFECLRQNILSIPISAEVRQIALTNYSGQSEFFLSTRGADSSLIEPNTFASKVSINVSTLDKAIELSGIRKIDLVKIEAEGNEPEVIEGAGQALRLTNLVAVDAGPERAGYDTLVEVAGLLRLNGLALQASVTRRGRFLFGRILNDQIDVS